MTEDQNKIINLQRLASAMKAAGQPPELIVDRLLSRDSPAAFKSVLQKVKVAGLQNKAIDDFIALPMQKQPLVTPEEMETKGFLGKAAKFTGVEPLGRWLGAKIAQVSPQQREILSQLEQQGYGTEAGTLSTGGVSGRQLAGSIAQTGLMLAAPFLSKALLGTKAAPLAFGERTLRGGLLGGAFGGSGAMQDEKADILTGILWGGVMGAAIPVVGAALRGLGGLVAKLPEKLYSQVFKKADDDIAALLKTGALQNLQKTNPQRFQQLVEKGIIRTTESGAIDINPALAREALDKGLRGTSEGMARYAYTKQLELESTVRDLVKGQKFSIPNKRGYISLLNGIKNEFSKIGAGFFSDRAGQAKQLITGLQKTKGNKISAEVGLRLRRFLDDMRNTSSFRENVNLSQKQEAFKVAANKLRFELANQIPGIKESMNDYRIFIETFNSIVEDAVRRGNRRLLGLTDILLGGGGMATGAPGVGLGVAAAVRGFQQPWALTNLGTGIERGLVGPTRSLFGQVTRPGIRTLGRTLIGGKIAQTQK